MAQVAAAAVILEAEEELVIRLQLLRAKAVMAALDTRAVSRTAAAAVAAQVLPVKVIPPAPMAEMAPHPRLLAPR